MGPRDRRLIAGTRRTTGPGRSLLPSLAPLATAALLAAGCAAESPETVSEPLLPLRPGTSEGRVRPGEGVRYRAVVEAGEVLQLRADQQEIDVEILLHGEDERPVDHAYGTLVPEELWWPGERGRELELEVRALQGPGSGGAAGGYLLHVDLGAADPASRRRAEAFWTARGGLAALAAGKPDAATKALEAALDLWREAPAPRQEAIAWGALATARERLDDRAGALAAYDGALAAAEGDPALEARLLHAQGMFYRRQWQLDSAETALHLAREAAEEAGDVYGEALLANDLAVLYDIRGELAAACEGFRKAHDLFGAAGFARQSVHAWIKLGSCLTEVGPLPEALPVLLGALDEAGDLSDTPLVVLALREVGWWHRLNGEPEQAESFLLRALELAPDDAGVHDRLGSVYTDLGRIDDARRHYRQALALLVHDPLEVALLRSNMCRLEELAGEAETALELCTESIRVLRERGAEAALVPTLLVAAGLELDRGRPRHAEPLAAEAVSLVEAQRPLAGDLRHRSAFFAERLAPHRLLVELRMELHGRQPGAGWDARALEIAELTRERGLLDLLRAKRVEPALHADPDLEREQNDLLHRLERVARHHAARLATGSPADPVLTLQRDALEDRLVAVRGRLRREAPSFSALSRPEPLDVVEIQRLLGAGTVLLVYHVDGGNGYVWSVSAERVTGRPLEDAERLTRLATSWYQVLSEPELGWVEPQHERAQAGALSAGLLGPVAEDLPGRRRLVVVAGGVLGRIPFAGLPQPLELGAPERPLVDAMEVVHLPSASVLPVLRRQYQGRPPAPGLLAVVADPVYGPDDPRLGGLDVGAPSRHGRWPRLEGSAAEARDLTALAAGPTLSWLGFEARRDRVLDHGLRDFRIVAFATHARTEGTADEPLGLLLSLYDSAGAPIEGWLGLPELYALDLPAEIALISACGTALGEEVAGDGLIGLTRGFMHAGTPRLLVSLWAVRDQASRELVRRFVSALLVDGAPAAALRKVQREMWQEGRPTRDWAAFALHGDWRPFPVEVPAGRIPAVVAGDKLQPLVSVDTASASPREANLRDLSISE